jgi:hypothetical protein
MRLHWGMIANDVARWCWTGQNREVLPNDRLLLGFLIHLCRLFELVSSLESIPSVTAIRESGGSPLSPRLAR